jgi:transposase-like protein
MTALPSMRNRPSKNNLFKGEHFEQEIIILCVRWYLRYKLSYRDLVEMMAERGLSVAHTTILRWVQRYAPEFDKRWSRFSAQAGTSWRVDETYVRIRGQWAYLYRAVDASGKTVDFRLSPRRNVASTKAFFRKAVRSQGRPPETIMLDGYSASHRAVRELQQQGRLASLTKLRSTKYLNNLIEQDHRNIKSRLGAMLGLKRLRFRGHHNSWCRAHASYSQGTVRLAFSGDQRADSVRNLSSCLGYMIGRITDQVSSSLIHNLHHRLSVMGRKRMAQRLIVEWSTDILCSSILCFRYRQLSG